MGWKGTLRTLAAAQRRSERAAHRRHNELVKQQVLLGKMAELEKASYEVDVYENRLEVLSSIHKDCSEVWDWEAIRTEEQPTEPVNSHRHEDVAQAQLNSFNPGVVDRLLKRTGTKREELAKAVTAARRLDEQGYHKTLQSYEKELSEWEATRDLANRILADDLEAFVQAIEQVGPFSELSELGSSIEFQTSNTSIIEISIHMNSEEVIPREVKTLLKSGKLSVKNMPKGKFLELYQDYVCGSVLRIARELFALLPVEMTIITALGNVLNTQTGHLVESPILSVAIPRTTLSRLNFESLDPSDSMSNFVHRMNFKKTAGFGAVEMLISSEIQQTNSETNPTAA